MSFTALPEGATTTVKSGKYGPFNQTKREAETRWVLGKTASGGEVVVDLTTRHDPDSKVFRSSCTWGTKEAAEPGSAFSVYTWSSDHAYVTLLRERVERYSKKALEETHARVLHAVSDDEAFQAVLAQVFNEAGSHVVEEVGA